MKAPVARRLYRLALRFLPEPIRRKHGDAMERLFVRQLEAAARQGGLAHLAAVARGPRPVGRAGPVGLRAHPEAPWFATQGLMATFALVGLALTAFGVYGVVSYGVRQRTGEIGIRMALGADAGSVARLVVGQGMLPVAAGLIVGTGAALLLTRFIESLLWGVEPDDPLTIATVGALLALVAAVAIWMPVREATGIDPNRSLRPEQGCVEEASRPSHVEKRSTVGLPDHAGAPSAPVAWKGRPSERNLGVRWNAFSPRTCNA